MSVLMSEVVTELPRFAHNMLGGNGHDRPEYRSHRSSASFQSSQSSTPTSVTTTPVSATAAPPSSYSSYHHPQSLHAIISTHSSRPPSQRSAHSTTTIPQRSPPLPSSDSVHSHQSSEHGYDRAGFPLTNAPHGLTTAHPSNPDSPTLRPTTYQSTRSLGSVTSPSRIIVKDLSQIQAFASEELLARSQPRTNASKGFLEAGQQYEISSMPVTDIIEMVAGLLTKITTTNDQQHEHLHMHMPPEGTSGMNQLTSSVLAFHGKNVPSISIASYLSRIHKYCPTTYEVFLSLLVYFDRMTERVNSGSLQMLHTAEGSEESQRPMTGSTTSSQPFNPPRQHSEGSRLPPSVPSSTQSNNQDHNPSPTIPPQPSTQNDSYSPSHFFVVDSFNIHRLIIAGVTCASKFFSDVFYTNSRYAKVGGLPLNELNHLELQFLLLNDFRLSISVEELEAYGTMLVEFYGREVMAQQQAELTDTPDLDVVYMQGTRLEGRLLFAVPKKGRLQQPTLDLLSGSDIQFRRQTRLDIALVKNLDLALVFLPAADIPTFVGEGRVDLGITGRDVIAEHETLSPSTPTTGVEEILDLGFGKCKLQVQVPEKGDCKTAGELVGRNIVTSFTGLTEKYFTGLEGAQDKSKTRIKYVGGSVEAACALGVADGIVDLVESGETMKAAGLKAIATVLESTAVLIRSKSPSNPKLVDLIANRIRGVIAAQRYVLCQYNVPRSLLPRATKITPGKRAPTITALEEQDWVAVSSMVEKVKIAGVMDELTEVGATDVLVLEIANSRTDGLN
ncbi:MAG: ATP phosphoribosyltransferase (ATP-PRTase) (ATP-PRT) [Cirrosporium novae-zelandiae]|nr:MAG: ATP phosphoribosyltransferase (ATP-PRTase) (ATP-PRT) [Cirrosporium novae-zelandiae]